MAEYDRRRFGSPSGEWVSEREISTVCELLPRTGRVLDLGCGTGRLSSRLARDGYGVILLDSSDAMLARAVPTVGAPAVLADAFALPFTEGAFDAVVALRVAFHFANLAALLQSAGRVMRPGGTFVFDTYRWSPRAIVAVASRQWGGKVYAQPDSVVRQAAARAGLDVKGAIPCFLFSPYLYRLLPMTVVRQLAHLEARLPSSTRARVFWSLEKAGA